MRLNNNLDPENWDDTADYLAQFTAEEIKALASSLEGKVWQAVPEALKVLLQDEKAPVKSSSLDQVIDIYRQNIRPYRNGNTHPRFFGWVQGSGTIPAMIADIAISAMNPNCGGRDHGAVYIERQVIDWCKQIFGFAQAAGGLLTSGTSTSTLLALQVAIFRKLGLDYKRKGFFGAGKPLRCYTSSEGHSSIIKAIQTCGIGSDNLVIIPTDRNHCLDNTQLERHIKQDIAAGFVPFMIIANAGSVNTGAFDNFDEIRQIANQFDCWMHVDGAFGAWMKIADSPYAELTRGMQLADSLAFDFHKLMYVQYDCGGLLIKDGALQQQVFSIRPDYLAPHGQALAGGDPWFCDFGLELSRSFRALKVWFTLKTYGLEQLGKAITRNADLAQLMATGIKASQYFSLCGEPVSNVLTFKLKVGDQENSIEHNNRRCEEIVNFLQCSGEAVFSLTRQGEYRVIRAAMINHRTSEADIKFVLDRLDQVAENLAKQD